jgi:HAD superfamily phosphatase
MPLGVLVFDMDGVLVDVSESYRETIRRTVKYFTGRDIENDRIQDLKNAGGWTNDWDVTHRLIEDLGGADGLMRREKWVARPGLLEDLGREYRLAVFTGRPRGEARMTLDRFAPHLTFDPLIGAEDVERGKPAPDGLRKIAALTGARKTWYVGDTVDDARSARAAGVPFIGVAAQTSCSRRRTRRPSSPTSTSWRPCYEIGQHPT